MDRGLRLAEKRQLPLGRERRQKWLDTRDELYEEIQVWLSTPLQNEKVDGEEIDERLERVQRALRTVVRRTRGARFGGADHAARVLLPRVGPEVPEHTPTNHAPAREGRAECEFVGLSVRCEQVG